MNGVVHPYMVVNWRELPRWDIKTARAAAFRLAHPDFRPLGEFAEESTELVRPWDEPDKEWPVYGVSNEFGVVFSHNQRGSTFSVPYKRIRKDWFFHNPTRANVGSLGRVPDVPADAITSPEYQVWRVKSALYPAYVEILIQTNFFMQLIAWHRVGAVKERLFVQNLLEIPVPVVALPMQHKIVAAYEAGRQKVDKARKGLLHLVRELDAELRRVACLNGLYRRSIVAQWKDLTTLDMKSARAATFRLDNPTFKPLSEFAEEATYFAKPWDEPEKTWPVYGVNNKEGVVFSHFQKGSTFNAPYKRIRKDWFFHNPTRSSVGSLGIVADVPDDAITSPEYQVWRIRSGLLPSFVATLISTQFFIDLIQVHRVGAVKQRLYVENLLQIPIPVVPDAIQQKFAERRESAMQTIAHALALAEEAKADAEAMILGMGAKSA